MDTFVHLNLDIIGKASDFWPALTNWNLHMQQQGAFTALPLCSDVKSVLVQSSSPAPTPSTRAVTSRPCSTTTPTAHVKIQPTLWWSGGRFVCARPPGSPAGALRLNTTSAEWASWFTARLPSRGWPPGCLLPAWVWAWVELHQGSYTSCTTPEQEGRVWPHLVSQWWRWA